MTPARGPLLIATLALLWGANFLWIALSLRGFTPVQLTFGRMILVPPSCCPSWRCDGNPFPAMRRPGRI